MISNKLRADAKKYKVRLTKNGYREYRNPKDIRIDVVSAKTRQTTMPMDPLKLLRMCKKVQDIFRNSPKLPTHSPPRPPAPPAPPPAPRPPPPPPPAPRPPPAPAPPPRQPPKKVPSNGKKRTYLNELREKVEERKLRKDLEIYSSPSRKKKVIKNEFKENLEQARHKMDLKK